MADTTEQFIPIDTLASNLEPLLLARLGVNSTLVRHSLLNASEADSLGANSYTIGFTVREQDNKRASFSSLKLIFSAFDM